EVYQLFDAFLGVCAAVGYAHTRGVIHRDLKPANVVLGEQGEVYLVDWGLAKALAGAAEAGLARPPSGGGDGPGLSGPDDTLGTPAYMAPEQASGQTGQVDHRSDIYG